MFIDTCPRCYFKITEDRQTDPVVVCPQCGYVKGDNEKKLQVTMFKEHVIVGSLVVLILSLAIVYTSRWGSLSVTAIVPNAKILLGMANQIDYQKISDSCLILNRYDCYGEMQGALAKLNPQNPMHYAEQAKALWYQKRFPLAVEAYKNYLNQGGDDIKVIYRYAYLLGGMGDVEQATELYESILQRTQNVIPVTIVSSYIDLLLDNGNINAAKKVIKKYRKKGYAISPFVEKQYRRIMELKPKGV